MTSEARRYPRRPLFVEVQARDRRGFGNLRFDSRDISEGGLFLRSDILFDEGERLELEFAVEPSDAPIRIKGCVTWVRRLSPEGEAGMGIRFLEVTSSAEAALSRFVAASNL